MTSTATTAKPIKPRDAVKLLKPLWKQDAKKGKQKILDTGIYEVESVMNDPDKVCLRWGKKSFWVPLEDVELEEEALCPEELITPVQGHVYHQFNGKPRGLWELVDILNQPSPIIKGALNALEKQGLIEEVELDVWRKVDEASTTGSNQEEGADTGDTSESAGDIPALPSESDEFGQTSAETASSGSDGNRGEVPLRESAVVSGEEEEDLRPEWMIEAERELNQIQWQIDNCSIEGATRTDEELKKACYKAYRENQKLFTEAVETFAEIASSQGYKLGFQSQPKDSHYNQIVVFAELLASEPRVAEPQSKLGEILNLATASEAKVVPTVLSPSPTLPELVAKANQLWEQRSQLEGELLHCLGEIYLSNKWKETHKTWTKYFIETFSHWQKAHRYRLKDAGEMFSQFLLSPHGEEIPLPTSEGQLRHLKALPVPERIPTWEQVVKEHGTTPSCKEVERVVKKRKVELQQPATLNAQFKTEEEIAAQFCAGVDYPVRVTYTGRSRGLESDVAPQHDGLIGVVQKLGVAGALVYVPILNLTMRCTPSQMVAVPFPSESRIICDRITALITQMELSPMVRGALEALSRQVEYSVDDLWLLSQIEERLTPLDQG